MYATNDPFRDLIQHLPTLLRINGRFIGHCRSSSYRRSSACIGGKMGLTLSFVMFLSAAAN